MATSYESDMGARKCKKGAGGAKSARGAEGFPSAPPAPLPPQLLQRSRWQRIQQPQRGAVRFRQRTHPHLGSHDVRGVHRVVEPEQVAYLVERDRLYGAAVEDLAAVVVKRNRYRSVHDPPDRKSVV